MMIPRVRLWLAALALSGVLAGQAQPPPAPTGVIRLSTDTLSRAPFARLIYPTLFDYAADDSLVFAAPGNYALVQAAERDGSTITLTLRDDLTWTDGAPVTPAEVLTALIGHLMRADWADTVTELRLPDDRRIAITFSPVSCAALPLLNAHAASPQNHGLSPDADLPGALRRGRRRLPELHLCGDGR